MNKSIVLINFYNEKALGIKHIETALEAAGYSVTVVYFKSMSTYKPKPVTPTETRLLVDLVKSKNPLAIGFSVMASFYMETIVAVNQALKKECTAPLVWGGIYPTMFPEECMKYADFVVRGEGEEATVELFNRLESGDFSAIRNLVYRDDNGEIVQNEIRELLTDLDAFGWPKLDKGNKYRIENDTVQKIDPLVGSVSYEIACSRGCPNACSYCCSAAWKKINARKGKAVRYREVRQVIDELLHAKAKMKNLKYIRFYDEIFPDDEAWVDAFLPEYTKKIRLPFEIWGNPRHVSPVIFPKLKKAGLYKAVIGLQSGSPYIRRQIFNRAEKNEDILRAAQIIADAKIPEVYYDLMLRHPFETHETLRETLQLCLELEGRFELQMHGLNFLPGTAIVQKALDMGVVSPVQMDKFLNAPMEEQYEMYWKNENCDEEMNAIYKLIFLSQVPAYKNIVRKLADPAAPVNYKKIDRLYKTGQKWVRLRHIYKKLVLLGKGLIKR
jgi:radical SAM superfamily enzyme YgiQ (UPF0313 family)